MLFIGDFRLYNERLNGSVSHKFDLESNRPVRCSTQSSNTAKDDLEQAHIQSAGDFIYPRPDQC